VTLDATTTDRAISITSATRQFMNSTVVLLHVATGVRRSPSAPKRGEEVEEDKAFLLIVKAEFESHRHSHPRELAFGDPVREIVKWVGAKLVTWWR